MLLHRGLESAASIQIAIGIQAPILIAAGIAALILSQTMITYPEALQLIELHGRLQRVSNESRVERVSLLESVGRTSAERVTSSVALPAFDTSAMDGFAVRSFETTMASQQNPLRLEVIGSVAAGSPIPPSRHSECSAWEIMTGAAFPEGFDACVRQEDVVASDRDADFPANQPSPADNPSHASRAAQGSTTIHGTIQISKPVSANLNRRSAGEDFAIGTAVIESGHRIRSEDLLCLAALGIKEVAVEKKIRVALIATGPELVPYDQTPQGTEIRNSTTPFLIAALREREVEIVHLATIGDNPAELRSLIDSTRPANFDVILTTGAISVGKYDYVAKTLVDMGLEIFLKKVTIRPGKPLLFGRLPWGPLVVGLPGNPVATATGLRFFIDPLLRALRAKPREVPLRAQLKQATHKTIGPTCFLKARLEKTTDGFEVWPHENQKASMTRPLLASNAWIALGPELPEEITAGIEVDVFPFVSRR